MTRKPSAAKQDDRARAPPQDHYEHNIVVDGNADTLTKALDALSLDGWEVITIVWRQGGEYVAFVRRLVPAGN